MERVVSAQLRAGHAFGRLSRRLASGWLAPLLLLPAVPAPAVGHMVPALESLTEFQDIGSPDAAAVALFPCQKRTVATCYGPDQIRAAYGFDKLPKGLTGAGVTIVIIGVFGAPTLSKDLARFDAVFGLGDPTLEVITPDGLLPFDYHNQNMVLGAGEAAIDVEWAHAIAPGAAIDLVLAKTLDDPDVLSAQQYAINHNLGAVLSQSFGEAESCMAPAIQKAQHKAFERAREERMTVLASSGDHGAAARACDGSPNFILSADTPASDPLVTSVGGTTLHADLASGAYMSETAWTDRFGRSGGGYSTLYRRPGYQRSAVEGRMRGVPDVAYNSGIEGGIIATFSPTPDAVRMLVVGGTSVGPPQWSGLVALANQEAGHRLGLLNNSLYSIAHRTRSLGAFHDITAGDNTWVFKNPAGQVVTIPGFTAGPGWDAVTGLGTPRADVLVGMLAGREGGEEGGGGGEVDQGDNQTRTEGTA